MAALPTVSLENWIGIYDHAHGEIGFDLGSMNRGALEKEAKTK